MLRQRVLTALVAAPVVLGVIFFAPLGVFALFFFVLALLGALEWFRLAGARGVAARSLALTAFGIAAGAFALLGSSDVERMLLVGACVLWLGAGAVVNGFPGTQRLLENRVVNVAAGALLLAAAWYALVALRSLTGGGWLVMWLFAIVWSADIGAYFAGRRFGRRKLAPAVSPGKTWEGVYGGLVASVAIGAAVGATVPVLADRLAWFVWAGLALPIAAVSIYGDLFESALKRVAGVKDSGTLLPGHGGVLDRIDSLIAVAPFFALWMLLSRSTVS